MSDPLVLCYHTVSPTLPDPINVRPQALAAQLGALVRRGYRAVTFRDAVLGSHGRGRLMAVTFDDAYASVAEHAFPILRDLGIPGSVFAVTDLVDGAGPMSWPGIDRWLGGPHQDELRGMGWEGLRALADAGWEVGSHTCRHPWLPNCDDQRLRHELAGSRAAIEERLGRRCDTLAYPYGGVDERVIAAARAAGYAAAGTIASMSRSGPLDQPRVGVYAHDDPRRFALKTSAAVRRVRSLLARPGRRPEPRPEWLRDAAG